MQIGVLEKLLMSVKSLRLSALLRSRQFLKQMHAWVSVPLVDRLLPGQSHYHRSYSIPPFVPPKAIVTSQSVHFSSTTVARTNRAEMRKASAVRIDVPSQGIRNFPAGWIDQMLRDMRQEGIACILPRNEVHAGEVGVSVVS